MSMISILSEIGGGVLSGLVATLFLYLVRTKWTKPRFDISETIVENNNIYSFKIQNNSKRTLSNIRIQINYHTNSKGTVRFPINDDTQYLHGRLSSGKENYDMFEKVIPIPNVFLNNRTRSNGIQERQIQEQNVEQFLDNNMKDDGLLEIAITFDDYHRIFGMINRITTRQYKSSDCIKKNSRFNAGQMETSPCTDTNNYTTKQEK